MLSGFFNSTSRPSSRLQSCSELKQIGELFIKLRDKVNKLGEASNQLGAGSIDFRKHRVMSALLDEIDQRIARFNLQPGNPSEAEKLALVGDLLDIVDRMRAAHNPILAWPRDQQRQIVDVSLTTGVYGLSLAAAAALPFASIGTLIAFFYAAPWLSSKARETTGLNNHRTASIRILEEWQLVLGSLQTNLGFRVLPAERIINTSECGVCPVEFVCPITDEIMDEPYVCVLDGKTYEKAHILRWLTEHRNSPFNRVELKPGQAPEEALILNRNLQELIEKFKEKYRVFVYAEDDVPRAAAADAAAAARPGV